MSEPATLSSTTTARSVDVPGAGAGARAALQAVFVDLLAKADIQLNGERPWDMRVHHHETISRILAKRSLGLGESYMDGWWDCEALDEFFYRLLKARANDWGVSKWMAALQVIGGAFYNRQSQRRAWEVAEKHYDLDNDLFGLMLDETMAYSCGYWRRAKTLHQAQLAKLDLICQKLGLEPGMRVLDIGCGWGSFTHYAAERYGVAVDGVTVSKEQAKHAEERSRGLPVTILLKDYREVTGQYDRIVSVGMFEHVGERNYETFMDVCARLLRPDGLVLLHTIGNTTTTQSYDPWINKYIFPNGKLPSLQQIARAAEGRFIIEDLQNFGPDYAKTLKAWDENFCANWAALALRYDERFYRTWRYYLNCCAGAFRTREIQLWQFVLSRPGGHEASYIAPR